MKPPRAANSRDRRFPFPSVPRFSPEIGPYAEVDWRQWARDLLAEPTVVVFLDVETTGFTFADAIVEIALLDLDGTVLLDTLLDPQMPIPAEVTAKHSITDAMVAGQPSFAQIRDALMAQLDGKCILAYNVQFDLRMVQSALYRLGEPLWTPVAHGCLQRAFTAYRAANAMPFPAVTGVSLRAACAAFGIAVQNTHRAMGDCQLALTLLRAMAA